MKNKQAMNLLIKESRRKKIILLMQVFFFLLMLTIIILESQYMVTKTKIQGEVIGIGVIKSSEFGMRSASRHMEIRINENETTNLFVPLTYNLKLNDKVVLQMQKSLILKREKYFFYNKSTN